MGLGSGIRDPEKTYSGSRDQKGTGSRIRNTAYRNGFSRRCKSLGRVTKTVFRIRKFFAFPDPQVTGSYPDSDLEPSIIKQYVTDWKHSLKRLLLYQFTKTS
jgi:hypothetical protein